MNIEYLKKKWGKVKEDFSATTASLAPFPVTAIQNQKRDDKKKLQKHNIKRVQNTHSERTVVDRSL